MAARVVKAIPAKTVGSTVDRVDSHLPRRSPVLSSPAVSCSIS